MRLAEYRKSLGQTQKQVATALGLKSKGLISMIEAGVRPASLRLALKIERWSQGKVPASEISAEAKALLDHPAEGRA
ncbi:MAG: helix-turn-helix transcriptional regulator [Caulobacter sp.]|nr:helix-turn-helix transcriptional regulator [Caulobacter sp.]